MPRTNTVPDEGADSKRGPRALTEDHKAALAAGREQGRAVRMYLEALDTTKPRRGRKRSEDDIQKRLDAVAAAIATADPLGRLALLQERQDLQAELESRSTEQDMTELEEAFVAVAKEYGDRKGICYAVWREVGVDPATLKRAGIQRAAA